MAIDRVVATLGVDGVVVGVANNPLIGVVTNQRLGLDRGQVPDGAVAEADLLHRVVRVGRTVPVEEHVGRDLVRGARDAQHQVVTRAGDHHIGRRHALLELHRAQLAGCGIVDVGDDVLAIALAEQVGVVAVPTVQGVVAGTTIQHIVATATTEGVVAAATDQRVVAVATIEVVVAVTAVLDVIAPTSDCRVVSASAHVDTGGT